MAEAIKKVEKIKEDGKIEELDQMIIDLDVFDKTLKESLYL